VYDSRWVLYRGIWITFKRVQYMQKISFTSHVIRVVVGCHIEEITVICPTPYINEDYDKFPCGKCAVCLQRRALGWIFRLQKEAERSSSAFFITYSYDTDHVPISENGYMSLSKRHFQLYMKKLRKMHKKFLPAVKLSYYTAGEYGSEKTRPHYHSIMFNLDLEIILGKSMAWQCLNFPHIYIVGNY